jgi:hypothetical protein
MFANAVETAQIYTRPVVTSLRYYDGTVEAGVASFVVVNDAGWIVTAAHVFAPMINAGQHQSEIAAYESAKAGKVKGGPKRNPKWITNHSYWWSGDGVAATNIRLDGTLDLAVGQLTPFDASVFSAYPEFKDSASPLRPGTSLCRLGFPFHDIKATFAGGNFQLPPDTFPIPFFPIEGIFTRNLLGPQTSDGKYTAKFIETSSPGLKGQSGGPIFDSTGVVWGIQSQTVSLPLGFSPSVALRGKQIAEHQFLNVGVGVHPEIIAAFLKDVGVKFLVKP